MKNTARDSYLFNEVMTAAPQKLHLMLLDAAIRSSQQAMMHWKAGENEQAGKCIMRAVRIITAILNGIDYQSKSDLVEKVAGVYLFIHRTLSRAYIDTDENKLAEALRLLAIERDTWRHVCEISAESTDGQANHNGLDTFLPAKNRENSKSLPPNLFSNDAILPDLSDGSFSLDA
jgi:flagellar protein FliS